MGFEIEIKAHLKEKEINSLLSQLKEYPNCKNLGKTCKSDIYWAKDKEDPPIFRTRYEIREDGEHILFTSKPLKKKDFGTEWNIENEFEAIPGQWELIQKFFLELGYVVCRKKHKEGFHFHIELDDYLLHCEVFEVQYLGWFIETEITFQEESSSIDKDKCEAAILKLHDSLGIDRNQIEPIGYNKMLVACGHPRG